MGLAASQARLLLLTARKSDLEYRAQCITNTEMVLAMQTETVARKYSERISNQALFFTTADNAAGTRQVALDFFNFISQTEGGYYIEVNTDSVDANGDPIYEKWEPKKDSNIYYTVDKYFTVDEYNPADLDSDGKPKAGARPIKTTEYNAGTELTQAEWNKLSAENKKNCSGIKYHEYNDGYSETQLLDGLTNGRFRIVDTTGKVISLSGDTKFTECYYTDDDAAAEAEYKKETAAIQVKEKRLQMELNQIEAQQKACDTEIDSVKKVMEKNVDRTFKVFS